ncbi:MAG TPA: glycosyltransferase family 1 protein [Candidatus Portnoybacteria bacterium]|nr:glycosyltransferase family 1 protein [Candidatus Portnoybacteria bacterium]
MTIGIDIRILASGKRSGIEEYLLNLLPNLFKLAPEIKFKLFYNAFRRTKLDYPWLELPNVEIKEFSLPNRFVFDPLATFLSQPKVDALLGEVDVFFSPHFLLTPLSKKCPRVITFHDLSFEYLPEFFSRRKRIWHWQINPRKQAQRANKIIAVSQSTKDDLTNLYHLPAEKIQVIHSGISQEFYQVEKNNPKLKEIREKYNLPQKFILYLGTIEPRKNLNSLILAFDLLKKEGYLNDCQLVLAGSRGWLYRDIFYLAKKSKFSSEILFPGFIQSEDKVYLYNLSSLFVYPSFFEGFGFPPLEAMACGVPTITSYATSFPEMVGSAALMIKPDDWGQLAGVIKEIWQDEKLREYLIIQGLEQSKKFSWQKTAEETLEILEKAHSSQPTIDS